MQKRTALLGNTVDGGLGVGRPWTGRDPNLELLCMGVVLGALWAEGWNHN